VVLILTKMIWATFLGEFLQSQLVTLKNKWLAECEWTTFSGVREKSCAGVQGDQIGRIFAQSVFVYFG
jgi:hypothetical protein